MHRTKTTATINTLPSDESPRSPDLGLFPYARRKPVMGPVTGRTLSVDRRSTPGPTGALYPLEGFWRAFPGPPRRDAPRGMAERLDRIVRKDYL